MSNENGVEKQFSTWSPKFTDLSFDSLQATSCTFQFRGCTRLQENPPLRWGSIALIQFTQIVYLDLIYLNRGQPERPPTTSSKINRQYGYPHYPGGNGQAKSFCTCHELRDPFTLLHPAPSLLARATTVWERRGLSMILHIYTV